MKTRFGSVVAAVTLLSITPGCTGMGNFLFGRGARCGLCNSKPGNPPAYTAPQTGPQCGQPHGYPAQQPCAPAAQPCMPAPAYSAPCGTCGEVYGSGYGGGCQCGTAYMGDPYMSGTYMGESYVGGEVIGTYPGHVVDVTEGVPSDQFVPRTTP